MAPRSDSAFLALQKPIEEVRDKLREQFNDTDVERVRRNLLSDFHKLASANRILDLPVLENFEPSRSTGSPARVGEKKPTGGRPRAGKKKMSGNTR